MSTLRGLCGLVRLWLAAFIAAVWALPSIAGPGYGDALDLNKQPFLIPTFFASSPSGPRLWVDAQGNPAPLLGAPAGYDPANQAAYILKIQELFPGGYPGTGQALRKFVDPLPLPGRANAKLMANGSTTKYIPVAAPVLWTKPDGSIGTDDYYEIAVVEYTDRFHSDLIKETTLRGYVQIDHLATYGITGRDRDGNTLTQLPGSQLVPLKYPDGTPIMVNQVDANGKLVVGANGQYVKVPAIAVDKPRYLGPIISATQGMPTRVKFLNLLPVGRAQVLSPAVFKLDGNGQPLMDRDGLPIIDQQATIDQRRGDIFLPLDPSVVGSGLGPDGKTMYTQNRANLHLHGGDNPWISDGTPHQWIAALGEEDPANPHALAADPGLDPTVLPKYLRGPGAINVPDMPDPGPGAMTYYFPNGQTARFEWYHDHTVGQTRLNVYSGMASAYVLTDTHEQTLIANNKLPGPDATIPLVLQDKTFVPDDIKLQDSRWNTQAWGAPGDLWYPHVYETVQDPNQDTNFNSVGRWHWGPWFWPAFPALYNLPSGAYGDVSLTPESWLDTPLVNGVAYPKLEVEPKAYRLRILNASNDRAFTFNIFVADPDSDTGTGGGKTEVKMVPVQTWPNLCAAGATRSDGSCVPDTWSTDVYGHSGGVPDPLTQGPTLYQIGSEGGWLPGVAPKDPTTLNYLLDKGRAAVLNVDFSRTGLHIANAERADVIVDFSKYAGKTLIVYNDSGAPVPAADPRNEYFTGYGDNSATGGAEDTRPGYGPNTRTIMQIVVGNSVQGSPGMPFVEGDTSSVTALDTTIKTAYSLVQERPVVAQSAYNAALGTSWNDNKAFAHIFTGTLKEPAFNFVPGTPNPAFNSILVQNQGSGYTRVPTVQLTAQAGDPGTGAAALAAMKINRIYVIDGGDGYTTVPQVNITARGPGSGAMAKALMKVSKVTVTAGGAGYVNGATANFALPGTPLNKGGRRATGQVVASGGVIQSITITDPGAGYTAAPTVTIPGAGSGARLASTLSVDRVDLDVPDPTNPNSGGGGGYIDLSTNASEPGNPRPGLTIGFLPVPSNGRSATAGATGQIFDVTVSNFGKGYTTYPLVSFVNAPDEVNGANIVQATAKADTAINPAVPQGSILVKTKAIQELFDPTYGRLNATLGVEIPYTSALSQTTIPLGYVDTPTEKFSDGETQIWKITHNGVDTHPVHFHLLNVQLINRVGWDNFVTPPEPNELGWKETVKMSPLEDAIVAVRAKRPSTGGGANGRNPNGFGVPNSVRLLDPSQPEGALSGFTQIDFNTGQPATMVNEVYDFGWEYVWHCHILGHEENDFMRPVAFKVNDPAPTPPVLNTVTVDTAAAQLNWTDRAWTEFSFDVMRADFLPSGSMGPFARLDTTLANSAAYQDTGINSAMTVNASGGTRVAYKVVANGAAGTGESNTVIVPLQPVPAAPTALTASAVNGQSIQLAWTDNASNEVGFLLERSTDGGTTWVPVAATTPVPGNTAELTNVAANATAFTDAGLATSTTYDYRLTAVNGSGHSAYATATATTFGTATLATLTATADSATQITLNWTLNPLRPQESVTQFVVVRAGGSGGPVTSTVPAGSTSFVDTSAAPQTSYTYVVHAENQAVTPTIVGASSSVSVTSAYAPAGTIQTFQAVAASATQVNLTWTVNGPATSYALARCTGVGCSTYTALTTITATGSSGSYSDMAVQQSTTYGYQLIAFNGPVNQSAAATATATTPAGITVAAPTNLVAVIQAQQKRIQLTWNDQSSNETVFLVMRSTDGVTFTQVGSVTRTASQSTSVGGTATYVDSVLTYGNTYQYRVVARAVIGANTYDSAPSPTISVAYNLNAPNGVTASMENGSVRVSWVDQSTAETQFVVWVSDNGGAFVQLTTTALRTASKSAATGGLESYMHLVGNTAMPLVAGHTYTYRVTAINGADSSLPSPTASITMGAVVPAAPTGLASTVAVTSATQATVTLSWTAVPTATSYTIQEQKPGGNWRTVGSSTTPTFARTGVTRNATTKYGYRISATNAAGTSGYTAIQVMVN